MQVKACDCMGVDVAMPANPLNTIADVSLGLLAR
jgi:hypothetical protein